MSIGGVGYLLSIYSIYIISCILSIFNVMNVVILQQAAQPILLFDAKRVLSISLISPNVPTVNSFQ